MSGAVPGEAVNIVRPDDEESVEYVPRPERVGVQRIETGRGYYQTQVRAMYDSECGRGDVSVKLFERSTDEEMVGIDFSDNHMQIMQHGPRNRGWQTIRDIVGPDADVVGGVSLNRDEARVVGEDLLYFADTGRLPGPATE